MSDYHEMLERAYRVARISRRKKAIELSVELAQTVLLVCVIIFAVRACK